MLIFFETQFFLLRFFSVNILVDKLVDKKIFFVDELIFQHIYPHRIFFIL